MIGEISAITAAATWAVSGIVLKSQIVKITALPLSALRCSSAALLFVGIFFIMGRASELAVIPLLSMAYLVAASVIGIALGDTLYIGGMSYLDISKVYPVSMSSYPLFTLIISVLFLNEIITWSIVLGSVLVVLGIILVAVSQRSASEEMIVTSGRNLKLGLLLSLAAAFCWSISASFLKVGLVDVDLVAANTIRLPATALVLLLVSSRRRGDLQIAKYEKGTLAAAVATGVLSYGIGGLLFLSAIQNAGAAKTVVLSSVSPLFVVPLSLIFLRERVTLRVILGTIICIIGIWLIV